MLKWVPIADRFTAALEIPGGVLIRTGMPEHTPPSTGVLRPEVVSMVFVPGLIIRQGTLMRTMAEILFPPDE